METSKARDYSSYAGHLIKSNGNQIPIFVELSDRNGRIEGRYYYKENNWLKLRETKRTYEKITLFEYNDQGDITGTFTLNIFDNETQYITGTFVAFGVKYRVNLIGQ